MQLHRLQSCGPYQWPGSTKAIDAIDAIVDPGHPYECLKEESGPQDCNPWSQFCLKKQFLKIHPEYYALEEVLTIISQDWSLCVIESVDLGEWVQLISWLECYINVFKKLSYIF